MAAELEVAIAQLFRKKGKSALTEKEFVFAASLDLRWFTPKEAQKLLDIGLESELLVMDGEKVKPSFDHASIDVQLGYKPDKNVLKAPVAPKGNFLKIVEHIASEKKMDNKEVISLVNQTQERMGVDIEVAALVVARSQGVDISKFLDAIEEEVGARYRK